MTRALAVLRPEPGNAATAARAEALGLRTIRLPLFAVRAIDWTPPDPRDHDALILTSANSLRHGGEGLDRLRSLPVFAVGARTAAAARAAGFDVMATGGADVASLLIEARAGGIGHALHLGGRDRVPVGDGVIGATIAVYASETLPIALRRLAELAGTVALLHSPRAAKRFGDLIDDRSTIRIAALSRAIDSDAGPGWADRAIAAAPDDGALLDAARALAD